MSYILNVIIALFFTLSLSMKIRSLHNFKLEISSYKIVPMNLVPLSSILVIIVELNIIISFIFEQFGYWKQVACTLLLVIFSALTWMKNKRTGQNTCSCFGSVSFLNKFPFIRNLTLISFSIISLLLPKSEPSVEISYHILLFVIWVTLLIELISTHSLDRRLNDT
ncbi:MauE/DoxX family redox-associated membrane protein [Paenibacillus yanchengensis]